jgi:hypothetical protein
MDSEKSFIGKFTDRMKRIAHIAADAANYAMQAEGPKRGSAGGRNKPPHFTRRAASGAPRDASPAAARTRNSERGWRDAGAPIYR